MEVEKREHAREASDDTRTRLAATLLALAKRAKTTTHLNVGGEAVQTRTATVNAGLLEQAARLLASGEPGDVGLIDWLLKDAAWLRRQHGVEEDARFQSPYLGVAERLERAAARLSPAPPGPPTPCGACGGTGTLSDPGLAVDCPQCGGSGLAAPQVEPSETEAAVTVTWSGPVTERCPLCDQETAGLSLTDGTTHFICGPTTGCGHRWFRPAPPQVTVAPAQVEREPSEGEDAAEPVHLTAEAERRLARAVEAADNARPALMRFGDATLYHDDIRCAMAEVLSLRTRLRLRAASSPHAPIDPAEDVTPRIRAQLQRFRDMTHRGHAYPDGGYDDPEIAEQIAELDLLLACLDAPQAAEDLDGGKRPLLHGDGSPIRWEGEVLDLAFNGLDKSKLPPARREFRDTWSPDPRAQADGHPGEVDYRVTATGEGA